MSNNPFSGAPEIASRIATFRAAELHKAMAPAIPLTMFN